MLKKRANGSIGLTISGISKNYLLDKNFGAEIRDLVIQHGIVFISGFDLSPDEHVLLASNIGPIDYGHPIMGSIDSNKVVLEINYTKLREAYESNSQNYVAYNPGGGRRSPDGLPWHCDITFLKNPPRFSILNAVHIPPSGGDTLWADQIAAFNALPSETISLIANATCEHDGIDFPLDSGLDIDRKSSHPAVIKHPERGEPALYVNRGFVTKINGLDSNESEKILDGLFRHSTSTEFSIRHKWTQGDLAIWDNRFTQHAVMNDFHPQHRAIHRVTVSGEPPEPYFV